MDSVPDFYFICTTNPPASLCASQPTFSSEDLFTSVLETCMHHGAIRCCYLISLRTKMNRGVSLWNISVCFDYNIQVLWLTSNQCWADVGGRHQPNVEATLGRHRTADVDPTSAQDMFPWSFFFTPWFARTSLHRNRPNAGCSDQFWSSPGMVTDLLYTNMKTWFILTHWGPDKMDAIFPYDIFKCIFLNANIWIPIKFSLKFVCKGPITWTPNILPWRPLTWNRNKCPCFCAFPLEFGGVGDLHKHQNRRVAC